MAEHGIFKLNDTVLQLTDSEVMEANDSFLNSSISAEKMHNPAPYFGDYLKVYYKEYRAVHGYLSFIICVFGIMANILNITVLTRKSMVSSINAILTGIAVADMLLMFSYLPNAYHKYIRKISDIERMSYGWAMLDLFTGNCTVVNHAISTWLTVTVAVWRYIAIRYPLKSSSWCSMTRAKYAITATYVTCAVLFIPHFITLTVKRYKRKSDGAIIYLVVTRKYSPWINALLTKTILSIFSVFIKFVPCVALTFLSLALIRAMNEAMKTRQILKRSAESEKSLVKTTKMLLAVVLLFLITHVPQGILVVLRVFLGKEFNKNVIKNLDETLDALIFINSSVNFIIYCSMSSKFRYTFSLLFIPKCIRQKESVPIAKQPKTSYEVCRGESYKITHNF